jgi:AGZA family xanthine/uracil permease-like MFS transporter
MEQQAVAGFKPKFWTSGDLNAFFGYGSNLLVNVLTLTGVLTFVVGMPATFVYTRVLPAVGIMLFLSATYYSWLAYQLAKKTGRTDVCALPSGPGVGHIFIVALVIMLPVKVMTGDYVKAWEAGMAWVFMQSFVIMIGGFAGEWVRKIAPRAALLSALCGIALTYIAIRPYTEMYLTPIIGMLCFAVILLDWFGGFRLLGRTPAGLIVIGLGALIAWGSNLVGLHFGGLTLDGVASSLTQFGFRVPIPAFGHVFSGFEFVGMLAVTAIPFGVYDIVEGIDNVESAAGAGDNFPTHRVLVADGVVSAIGAILGNPFMLVVYVGHPGWKAMGGRIGYCAASGLLMLVVCVMGIVPVMLSLVPIVAVYPILLFIAMIIGSQAFRETPARHAPAIVLGILPHLAHWAQDTIANTLSAVNVTITPEVEAALATKSILYEGLKTVGDGAVLSGIVMASAAVFVIEGKLIRAAVTCVVGAVFTTFGLMHAPQLGIGQSPTIMMGYLLVGVVMLIAHRLSDRHKEDALTQVDPAHDAELVATVH